jgi:ABC-type phosphate transport system substrate-binding protein
MPRVTIGLFMLGAAMPLVLPLGISQSLAVGRPDRSATANVMIVAPTEAVHGSQAGFATYRDLADSLGIVLNRSNPVENLSFAELRKIFLGEQSHWSNGRRITVVMLEPGKQERQAVLAQIYRMDDKEFDKHFSQGQQAGETRAVPKILATSSEVLKFVSNVPGAIGYVRVTEADDSVKVIHIDSRLPGDKDYGIRLHSKSAKQ